MESENYETWKPIDEQMDAHERLRLLYVACTRARDHLIVSLHRRAPNAKGTKENSAAWALADAGAAGAGAFDGSALLDSADREAIPTIAAPAPASTERATLPDRQEWELERQRSLAAASAPTAVSATGLAGEDSGSAAADAGLDKDRDDSEPPPWSKGRYGTAIGRAVHGVLQDIDLGTGRGLEALAGRQAAAEGVSGRTQAVTGLARAALGTDVARQAAAAEHWRELFVAAPFGERLVEGYVDLVYRGPDGLVVVDWKTDSVAGDDGVDSKLARYRLQGAAYAAALEAVTGEQVARMVFVFLNRGGAVEAELPDLRAAVEEAKAAVARISGSIRSLSSATSRCTAAATPSRSASSRSPISVSKASSTRSSVSRASVSPSGVSSKRLRRPSSGSATRRTRPLLTRRCMVLVAPPEVCTIRSANSPAAMRCGDPASHSAVSAV